MNVSLHHWDDESETSSGRRTADSEGRNVSSGQPGGGKTHNASTPHRSVFVFTSCVMLWRGAEKSSVLIFLCVCSSISVGQIDTMKWKR